jgi:pimeloyl-ACP methyl ester carboxylesterase
MRAALATALAGLLVGACAAGPSVTGRDATGTSSPDTFTSGAVAIGDDRAIQAECSGSGSPTVVLIPGSRESGEVWQVTAPSSGDLTPDALVFSEAAVFPSVSSVTRVCTYDRPGVPLLDGTISGSTLVPQPTTAQDGASDLDAWLTAAGVDGPYVLVAHSWGGLIAMRYAQEHPGEVAGLVLVDPSSVQLRDELTPKQWQSTLDLVESLVDGSNVEVPDYAGTVDIVASGPTVSPVPAVVLTSDKPFDFAAGDAPWSTWVTAHDRLAESLGARHITDTDSGHLIMVEQPELVASAVRDVVVQVRQP